VAGEDIQTQEFSVRTRQEPPPGPGGLPQAEGYTVRSVFEVTIRDLDRAGQLPSAATDAGGEATRIQGMSFGIEDDDAQQRQAREQAFQDARDKAEQYADLVGRELVSVTELGGPTAPPAAAAETAAPPVEPGQLTVRVHVQVTWALG
jgi:uncharacterized protein